MVILVGLAPTDERWRARLPGIDQIVDSYSRELASIDEPGTFYIDMDRIVDRADPYRTLHLDGIHLNEQGHALLAQAIAHSLRPEVLYPEVVAVTPGGDASSS